MKFIVKPKVETTEQLNLRIPSSLRQRIDSVRGLADESGVDYNATLIGVIDQFNSELETQLRQSRNKTNGSGNPAS
jgi:hypothetical protein